MSSSRALRRGRSAILVAVLSVLAVVGIVGTVPADADDGTATLSGAVTAYDGEWIGSVRVVLYADGQYVTYTDTDAGRYTFTGLAPGKYQVAFRYCCSARDYIAEWGDGTHGAAQVTPNILAAGPNSLDAVLDPGGHITGRITAAGGPLSGMKASVIPLDSTNAGLTFRAGVDYLGNLWTDPLPPGSYGVVADAGPEWQTEDHNGVKTNAPTEPGVQVSLGNTSSVAIDLESSGEVSGTVLFDQRDGTTRPAAGVTVNFKPLDYYRDWPISTTTGADGRFLIRGLSGNYAVSFESEYSFPEFYGGARESTGAENIFLGKNEVRGGIDATLELGGRVEMMSWLTVPDPWRPNDRYTHADTFSADYRRLDDKTGQYVRQIPVEDVWRGSSVSGLLEPGVYEIDVFGRRYLGDMFDWATPSPSYRTTVERIVVKPGARTPVGDFVMETDYWGTVHPPASGAAPSDAGAFTSLDPARILDTRIGNGAAGIPIKANSSVELQVTGRGGVPAAGVNAVVMNVTATDPKAGGFITVYPVGVPAPQGSSLNFSPGQTVPNLVTARVGTDGKVRLTNNSSGTVHLIADVAGFYASGAPTSAGTFQTWRAARMMDTRESSFQEYVPTLGPFQTVRLRVHGRGGVVTPAPAVAMNVTVTNPTADGFLTAYPSGTAQPTASNLNFTRGQTVPNHVVVKVGADGFVSLTNNSAGTVDVIADLSGYYRDGTAVTRGAFTSLDPTRLLDTRVGNGAPRVAVGPNQTIDLQVTGRGGVPASDVSSVVMNVTVTGASAGGFLTAYPSGTARPTASNLNFSPGQTVPNLVAVRVGADGKVRLTNSSAGTVHMIADVAGYFLKADQPVE